MINKVMLLLAVWSVAKHAQVVAGYIPTPGACEYIETTGHDSRRFVWTLEEDDGWLLTSEDERERHRAWLDKTLDTRKWSLDRSNEKAPRPGVKDLFMASVVAVANCQDIPIQLFESARMLFG